MNALAFDTLRFAKRMQEAGLPQAQAEALSEALAEAVKDSVATRSDIEASTTALRADLSATLNKAVAELRVEIREAQVTLIKWLVPLMIGQAAVTAALVRLL
jgi:uncharacterized protein involved in cysteine biosynthesis